MLTTFRNFLADETGATTIEYGLIAVFISVSAIVALTNMGHAVDSMFERVSLCLQQVVRGEAPLC